MRIIIDFDTDNDTFKHEGFIHETCRLIDQVKLTAMNKIDGDWFLNDFYGNKIGSYTIEGAETNDKDTK